MKSFSCQRPRAILNANSSISPRVKPMSSSSWLLSLDRALRVLRFFSHKITELTVDLTKLTACEATDSKLPNLGAETIADMVHSFRE